VPTTNAAGTPQRLRHYLAEVDFTLKGSFTATYHVEIETIRGEWEQVGVAITASIPPRALPNGALRVRVRRSAHTSGQPKAIVSGPMDH
jgi:hypothetical protein